MTNNYLKKATYSGIVSVMVLTGAQFAYQDVNSLRKNDASIVEKYSEPAEKDYLKDKLGSHYDFMQFADFESDAPLDEGDHYDIKSLI